MLNNACSLVCRWAESSNPPKSGVPPSWAQVSESSGLPVTLSEPLHLSGFCGAEADLVRRSMCPAQCLCESGSDGTFTLLSFQSSIISRFPSGALPDGLVSPNRNGERTFLGTTEGAQGKEFLHQPRSRPKKIHSSWTVFIKTEEE